MNFWNATLANPGKIFGDEHINHPRAAHPGFHDYRPGRLFRCLTDDAGVPAERIFFHRCKNRVRVPRLNKGDQPPFIRQVERIQSEDFADALYLFPDRKAFFMDGDTGS